MFPHFVPLLILAAGLALIPDAASAQTATDVFVVSITVENDCTITMSDLSFGSANDLTAAIDAAASGSVTCTGMAPISISFDTGTGAGSTFATRRLEQGAETIDYNLYRDAARTEVLGDGTGATFRIALTSSGGADAFDVFGRTEPGQNPKPAGTYTSTITATVEF